MRDQYCRGVWGLVGIIGLLAQVGCSVLSGAGGHLRLEDRGDRIVVLRDGLDRPLVVQNARKDFRPFLHPIVAPDGNGELTQYSPGHHKHQTGLYWGYTRLADRDYFHHPEGDHWRQKRKAIETSAGNLVSWMVEYDLLGKDGSVIIKQTERWSCQDRGDHYFLDLHWTGQARADITFPRYKYGGLFLRMPWTEETGGVAINDWGQKNEQEAEGQSARWVDVGVPIEGRDDWGHIAILDHPHNEGHPVAWRVDGQLGVGPCRSRLGEWKLAKGESADMKYRLMVYTGDYVRDRVEAAWHDPWPGIGETYPDDRTPPEHRPDSLVDLFESKKGGTHYRIPALITTKTGTLLAFCEARRSSLDDAGDIDLVVRRSTDGGESWSPDKIVWDAASDTCGNPCPVVDQTTGRIWLPMTWNRGSDHEGAILAGKSKNPRHVYMTYSDDDGQTWATPTNLSKTAARHGWRWYATGPGNAIQLTRGEHAGRLVIPANHSDHAQLSQSDQEKYEDIPEHYYRSHVFYSDDHGETWKVGGVLDRATNESTIVELPDGSILNNMRSYEGIDRRTVSVSRDGGDSWEPVRPHFELVEPVCQGNMLRYSFPSAKSKSRILFSNPASPQNRERLTVRVSYDEGET
jgi:hypothetical protein